MTSTELKDLLKKLSEEKERAFAESIPNAPILTRIVSDLMALEQDDKFFFKDFVVELSKNIFQSGASIKGLNINQFLQKSDRTPSTSIVSASIGEFSLRQAETQELLNKVLHNLKEYFEVFKGYFITKLEKNPLIESKLLILYDETYFITPIKRKIDSAIPGSLFKKIKEFSDELEKGDVEEVNFVCLLLLTQKANDDDGLQEVKNCLETIVNSFSFFESYSLKHEAKNGNISIEKSISKIDFFDEVDFITRTLLSNGAIKHEEEKIVKKLFKTFQTPLLIYKTLKGGNSGSKVIEIRPKKEMGNEFEKKYIIKFGQIDSERKIEKEAICFGKWINGYKGFNDYECQHEKTLTHEGLKYSYAISDDATESFSYYDIIEKKDNFFHDQKVSIIDELFAIDLFQRWKDSLEQKNCKVSELYSSYINIDKIKIELLRIIDKIELPLENHELIVNFNKIWNLDFEFNVKVCHGDLHTENFFKDKSATYLIDFGFTDRRHAIIDQTSLECSIKFRHVPMFIETAELIRIEEELVLDQAFQLSTRFSGTQREEFLDLLEIIKKIRYNSSELIRDNTSSTEYLISLFIMTFRQIRYADLNQRYAYNSALILSRILVTRFRL